MFKQAATAALCVAGWFVTSCAMADPVYVSGQFSGDEIARFNIHETCDSDPLPHQQTGPITVSQSGSYAFRDAGRIFDVDEQFELDIELSVHTGPVNQNNPTANLVGTVDDAGNIELNSGQDYFLVVQPWCNPGVEVWGMLIDGPGEIDGTGVIPAPAWSFGDFDGNEPLLNLSADESCPETYYDEVGPVTVERTGTYYLHATEHYVFRPNHVAVYRASFDPDRPHRNRIARGVTSLVMRLEAGRKYFFVVQPDCVVRTSDWKLVLFPPRPFKVNPGLNGSWVDPTTDGQGMFMDVFPNVGVLFLAWFTYDSMAPAAGETREIGKPGNTWLVAQGLFEDGDTSVDLDLFYRGGGRFNDPSTTPDPIENVGSGVLDMRSCTEGTLHYDLDAGEAGSAELRRIALDNVELCESFFPGPGVIGE